MKYPDEWVHSKARAILKYFDYDIPYNLNRGGFTITFGEVTLQFAKKKALLRKVGELDWVHYTPMTLARAILDERLEEYLLEKQEDSRSPVNVWKDKKKEEELKAYYRKRALLYE